MREERLERVSTLKVIKYCWKGIDDVLSYFLQAHHFYAEVINDIGKSYEFRGRYAQNQLQVITNNALKVIYRTSVDANSDPAFQYAHKWMKDFEAFAIKYNVDGPDINTYTPMICICGRAYEISKAHEWFDVMVSKGIVPDTFIYNVLMDALANSLNNAQNPVQGALQKPHVDEEEVISKVGNLFHSLQNSDAYQPDSDTVSYFAIF